MRGAGRQREQRGLAAGGLGGGQRGGAARGRRAGATVVGGAAWLRRAEAEAAGDTSAVAASRSGGRCERVSERRPMAVSADGHGGTRGQQLIAGDYGSEHDEGATRRLADAGACARDGASCG